MRGKKIYFLLFVFIVAIFFIVEYVRSILLFYYMRFFLDFKEYKVFVYMFLLSIALSLLSVCIIPDIYNIFGKTGKDDRNVKGDVTRSFIASYGSLTIIISAILLIGFIIALTIPIDPSRGYPHEFMGAFAIYFALVNLIIIILVPLHYGLSPFIYQKMHKPTIMISYFHAFRYLVYNLRNFLKYIVFGLFIAVASSIIVYWILSAYGLNIPIYYDNYILRYREGRAGLVEFVDRNVATYANLVQDVVFVLIALLFYSFYLIRVSEEFYE